MRDRFKKALNVGGVVLLVAIVLPFVVFAVPQTVGASHSHVVLSDSMAPAIEAGDVIIERETPPDEIQEGDVITFRGGYEGRTTTHRVVNITNRSGGLQFQTKGDANEAADANPVTPDRVVGVVAFTIPALGHVIQRVDTDLGLFATVVVPGFLFVCNEVYLRVLKRSDGTPDTDPGGRK